MSELQSQHQILTVRSQVTRLVQLPTHPLPASALSQTVTRPFLRPLDHSAEEEPLPQEQEQMLEAQEMFRTENKVTRPEKALILGFMAGSRYELYCFVGMRILIIVHCRDNPCPHLGNKQHRHHQTE